MLSWNQHAETITRPITHPIYLLNRQIIRYSKQWCLKKDSIKIKEVGKKIMLAINLYIIVYCAVLLVMLQYNVFELHFVGSCYLWVTETLTCSDRLHSPKSPPTLQGHRVAVPDRAATSSTAHTHTHTRPSLAACYQCHRVQTDSTHGGWRS